MQKSTSNICLEQGLKTQPTARIPINTCNFAVVFTLMGTGIAQSVQRLATGWKVWGSNPNGKRFFAPIQTGSGAHPASCTMGTGFFPGVKAAEAWCWPHTPSSAEVKKELSCTSTHRMGPPGPVTGFPLPLPFTLIGALHISKSTDKGLFELQSLGVSLFLGTRPRVGRPRNRVSICGREWDLYIFQSFRIGSGAQPGCYLMSTRNSLPG
jgi:hypothetical protein